MGKDNDDDTKGDDEMDTEDDKKDDEMDTEDDKKYDKMDYKTKVFDIYYTKFDHPVTENNIIYNASGASYDALGFLKYYEQHSDEINDSDISLKLQRRID